jgi:selenoprotein W-related protein
MPGGMFFVQCWKDRSNIEVLWDRLEEGSFPDSKELKQLVRDEISPKKFLGHSDTKDRQESQDTPLIQDDNTSTERGDQVTQVSLSGTKTPSLSITYCTGCRWLYRAAYFGLEVLTTFDQEINSFSLIPSRPPSKGGQFTITLNDEIIWDREREGGFPEVSRLKRIIRDSLAPGKDLGHTDEQVEALVDEMDDDESEGARRFFGVA